MSMRLPLNCTVLEMPPRSPLASSTMTRHRAPRSNSRAAVSPAGPAPMMTIVLVFMVLKDLSVAVSWKEYSASWLADPPRYLAACRFAPPLVCLKCIRAKSSLLARADA